VIEQYFHGVFHVETPSNMVDVVVPMHMVQQCYLVVPAALRVTKRVRCTKKLGMIIIEILNKKGLKNKHSRLHVVFCDWEIWR
jgi:hypothetical protein